MLQLSPFAPADLDALDLQAAQAMLGVHLADPVYGELLATSVEATTGRDDTGRVLGCAGVLPMYRGVGRGWALLGPVPKRLWVPVTYAIRVALERAHRRFHRIVTTVDLANDAQHRWAQLLGFEAEGIERQGAPDRRDLVVYARVLPPGQPLELAA